MLTNEGVSEGMLGDAERVEAMTCLGRALSDPTRCRILLALLDGAAYPAHLAHELDLTRPNVSNHLSLLRSWGLVSGVAEGRQIRYALTDSHLAHALQDLVAMLPAHAASHHGGDA